MADRPLGSPCDCIEQMSVSAKHAQAYAAYLNSPQWQAKRREALMVAGHCCQRCAETENLEVHHLTYDRLGFERPDDLQVLCNACHAREHGRPAKHDRVVGVMEAFWKGQAHGVARDALEDEQFAILQAALEEADLEDQDPERRRASQRLDDYRREWLS